MLGKNVGKGISFPPRVGSDGRMVWSEGEANIRECIQVILRTESQTRIMLPGFGCGLARYLFEPNTVTTRHAIEDKIQKALAEWEPRIAVESISVEEDPDDPQAAVATVNYRLVSTRTRERVNLTVKLGS